MYEQDSQKSLQTAIVVALASLFFVLAMGIAIVGAGVYSRINNGAEDNYTQRTALSYLVNQVRRSDVEGGIDIGDFGDGGSVFLTKMEGGYEYVTCLYLYGGNLMELYTEAGTQLNPQDGTAIVEINDLAVDYAEGVITFNVVDNKGEEISASIAPRTEVGGV